MQDFTFSMRDYINMLNQLRHSGYEFLPLGVKANVLGFDRPTVFMRHDVDISLKLALIMARIEKNEGVCSSYFICVRSPFYNPLTPYSSEIINEINALGHNISLHVVVNSHNVQTCIDNETKLLVEYYPFLNTDVVTIHSPTDMIKIPPLLHIDQINRVYGPILGSQVVYFSDSGGAWRPCYPCTSEHLNKLLPIHLLTHPIWWLQNGKNPLEKLQSFLSANADLSIREYKEFLPKLLRFGQNNEE